MCNQQTQQIIEDVVAEKVQGKQLFTAFDVTLAVQAKLKQDGLFDPSQHRHQHLKNDVHTVLESYVQTRQYERSLQDVGAPTPAFVYYPAGDDPSAYTPLSRNDKPAASNDPYVVNVPSSQPATTTAVLAPVGSTGVATVVDNSGDGVDIGRTPDARGTLTVSSFLLRAIGFKWNDTAYVIAGVDSQDRKQLVISKDIPNGSTPVTNYTVDYSGNVRITKATLDYALGTATSYDFEGDTTQVVVRVHA